MLVLSDYVGCYKTAQSNFGRDGLWDNLYRDEVVEQMAHPSLEEVAHGLIETASHRMKRVVMSEPGKPDDLSFILYRQSIRTA